MNTIGANILTLRKGKKMTQEELAARLHVTPQAVSKWENGATLPDTAILADLAAALDASIDILMGYAAEKKRSTRYEEKYAKEEYYWGVRPTRMAYDVLRLIPPDRPLRLLDIGCGEGQNAVFFAKNGYRVSAFDLTKSGISKAKALAERHRVQVDFFTADLLSFRLEERFDVIFCSGVLHYLPQELREEIFANLREHTSVGGLNAVNAFVRKPFIPIAPDKEGNETHFKAGELFGCYTDWEFLVCKEEIFDCGIGGVLHKHCMDSLCALKP